MFKKKKEKWNYKNLGWRFPASVWWFCCASNTLEVVFTLKSRTFIQLCFCILLHNCYCFLHFCLYFVVLFFKVLYLVFILLYPRLSLSKRISSGTEQSEDLINFVCFIIIILGFCFFVCLSLFYLFIFFFYLALIWGLSTNLHFCKMEWQ